MAGAVIAKQRILNEFERRTDKSAEEGLSSFLDEKIKRILAILTEKFCTRKDANCVLELCKEASGEDKDRILTCSALDLLPRLVKEKSGDFIKKLLQVPGERHIHPTVLFFGEDAVSSASMQVAVEGLTVDVADVVEGVSLMMAMFWAFDMEYRPSEKNTLVILERAMDVKETTEAMTALKIIGSL